MAIVAFGDGPPKDTTPKPIRIHLEMKGPTRVAANIMVLGNQRLRLLVPGTFLDNSPVHKANVTHIDEQNMPAQFLGISKAVDRKKLGKKEFLEIDGDKGKTIEFDVAEIYDLSSGGKFSISMEGYIPYADKDAIIGSVRYTSNRLAVKVSGARAERKRAEFLHTRTKLSENGGCKENQKKVIDEALTNCVFHAQAALEAAQSGPGDLLLEYFHNSDNFTRVTVASIFERMIQECENGELSVSEYFCQDEFRGCSPGTGGYVDAHSNRITYCDDFFSSQPFNENCDDKQNGEYYTRVHVVVHEMTHLRQLGRTLDYAYGYGRSVDLGKFDSLHNADSYAFFASAAYRGCKSQSNALEAGK